VTVIAAAAVPNERNSLRLAPMLPPLLDGGREYSPAPVARVAGLRSLRRVVGPQMWMRIHIRMVIESLA
jgi:hypothetical protein